MLSVLELTLPCWSSPSLVGRYYDADLDASTALDFSIFVDMVVSVVNTVTDLQCAPQTKEERIFVELMTSREGSK